jgi:hypothetical protein
LFKYLSKICEITYILSEISIFFFQNWMIKIMGWLVYIELILHCRAIKLFTINLQNLLWGSTYIQGQHVLRSRSTCTRVYIVFDIYSCMYLQLIPKLSASTIISLSSPVHCLLTLPISSPSLLYNYVEIKWSCIEISYYVMGSSRLYKWAILHIWRKLKVTQQNLYYFWFWWLISYMH